MLFYKTICTDDFGRISMKIKIAIFYQSGYFGIDLVVRLRATQTDSCDQSILIFLATNSQFVATKLDFKLLCLRFTFFN